MPIPQLTLHGSEKQRQTVDQTRVDACLQGDQTLTAALGLGAEFFAGMRRQAWALHDTGKHQRAIDIILGLAALGNVEPGDPALLALCYHGLGNESAADLCAAEAETLKAALALELQAQGET
ncbi:MAG: hypothetical protein HY903_24605 [Deltaproteobacteria bacterium]|nr:hypothetical protein [Deltaproteobacteria bacterium]